LSLQTRPPNKKARLNLHRAFVQSDQNNSQNFSLSIESGESITWILGIYDFLFPKREEGEEEEEGRIGEFIVASIPRSLPSVTGVCSCEGWEDLRCDSSPFIYVGMSAESATKISAFYLGKVSNGQLGQWIAL